MWKALFCSCCVSDGILSSFCTDIHFTCIKSTAALVSLFSYKQKHTDILKAGEEYHLLSSPIKARVISTLPTLSTTVFVFVTHGRRETWWITDVLLHLHSSTAVHHFPEPQAVYFHACSSIFYLRVVLWSHILLEQVQVLFLEQHVHDFDCLDHFLTT